MPVPKMVAQPTDVLSAGLNALSNTNLPMLSNMGKAAEGGAGAPNSLLSHSMEVPTSVMAMEVGGNLLGNLDTSITRISP